MADVAREPLSSGSDAAHRAWISRRALYCVVTVSTSIAG